MCHRRLPHGAPRGRASGRRDRTLLNPVHEWVARRGARTMSWSVTSPRTDVCHDAGAGGRASLVMRAMARSKTKKTSARRARTAATRPDPLLELISAYWMSQLVFVAAKLGVADELAKGPLAVDVLAR